MVHDTYHWPYKIISPLELKSTVEHIFKTCHADNFVQHQRGPHVFVEIFVGHRHSYRKLRENRLANTRKRSSSHRPRVHGTSRHDDGNNDGTPNETVHAYGMPLTDSLLELRTITGRRNRTKSTIGRAY